MAERRFCKEIEGNLNSPEHDRIVRLLTAFRYHNRFYLVYPFANKGSLDALWKTYTPNGIVQESSQIEPNAASWYSEMWLIGECLGIADALAATHGLRNDHAAEGKGFLHADIKPENILCFRETDSKIVLKLADFGEATPVKSGLKTDKVARILTYRPPEYSPENTITLNYDVWSLGCLFLGFVNWAILGPEGIESFEQEREDEQDEAAITEKPGQMTEDTFFKRIRKEPVPFLLKRLHCGRCRVIKVNSGKATTTYSLGVSSHVDITSRVKDAVVSVSTKQLSHGKSLQFCLSRKLTAFQRLSTLKHHSRCTGRLKLLLSFVGERMLVVDPSGRADSREVRDYLRALATGDDTMR
jgi:serine/threonine protein kinase